MSDFESEIEHELHRVLDPALPGTIPAWRVPRPWSLTKRILGGAGVAVGFKVLTGIALAAAAATIAGAATETVITGSVNPSVWGQQVQGSVQACKDRFATSGQHGIGECVSDFASKHGEWASDSNQSPEAAETKSPDAKKPAHAATPGHSDSAKPRAGATSTPGAEHRLTPTAPRP
jgi:hypothetical protein